MKSERSRAINRADKAFSEFIRRRGGDYAVCFTCGNHYHWKKIHCGHFQGRQHINTRWHEINCQSQCAKCDTFNDGEKSIFGKELNRIYGKGTSEKLIIKSKILSKVGAFEIGLIEKIYKQKNKERNGKDSK